MSDLRSRIIRLAAANPELRADLLPLLKEDANPASADQNKPESYYGLAPRGVQAAATRTAGIVSVRVEHGFVTVEGTSVLGRGIQVATLDARENGTAATRAAISVASEFGAAMEQMSSPDEAIGFLGRKVFEITSRRLRWKYSRKSASRVASLSDLEAALRKARKEVFDDNQVIADAASVEIKRLRKLIEAHPDEVTRRDQSEYNRSERMLRLWQ